MYCSSAKQIAILELMMEFYKRALAVIKAGAPIGQVTKISACDEIVRIKMVYKNEEVEKINIVDEHLNAQLGELERVFIHEGV